jgi:hypothetical protein
MAQGGQGFDLCAEETAGMEGGSIPAGGHQGDFSGSDAKAGAYEPRLRHILLIENWIGSLCSARFGVMRMILVLDIVIYGLIWIIGRIPVTRHSYAMIFTHGPFVRNSTFFPSVGRKIAKYATNGAGMAIVAHGSPLYVALHKIRRNKITGC